MSADPLPPPPWRTRPRVARERRPLTQEAIVRAALGGHDAGGHDPGSMRRVAQELGTGPASLYQHVSGKDELLELMLDLVAGEVESPDPPDPARWQEQLRDLATRVWRSMTAHPGIAFAAIARVPTGPNALALTEALLGILRAGGLSDRECSWAMDNLYKFLTADAFEESVYIARGQTEASLSEYHEQLGAYFASLPADRFPTISSMVGALMEGGGEERFAFGLDLMISGLAARRSASPSEGASG
jgi:AcrR family transcriptional regulator